MKIEQEMYNMKTETDPEIPLPKKRLLGKRKSVKPVAYQPEEQPKKTPAPKRKTAVVKTKGRKCEVCLLQCQSMDEYKQHIKTHSGSS